MVKHQDVIFFTVEFASTCCTSRKTKKQVISFSEFGRIWNFLEFEWVVLQFLRTQFRQMLFSATAGRDEFSDSVCWSYLKMPWRLALFIGLRSKNWYKTGNSCHFDENKFNPECSSKIKFCLLTCMNIRQMLPKKLTPWNVEPYGTKKWVEVRMSQNYLKFFRLTSSPEAKFGPD